MCTDLFYAINGKPVTMTELLRSVKTPLGLMLAIPLHLLRLPITTYSDIPAVKTFEGFEAGWEDLPQDIQTAMFPEIDTLAKLGFSPCLCHEIRDTINHTHHATLHMVHEDGVHFARVHHLCAFVTFPAKTKLMTSIYQLFDDGQVMVTTSAQQDWNDPPNWDVIYLPGMAVKSLWDEHQRRSRLEQHRSTTAVNDELSLSLALETVQHQISGYLLDRKLFVEAEQTEFAQKDSEYDMDVYAVSELIRIKQARKQNTLVMLVILLISIGLFLGLGAKAWSFEIALLLIPILLFHELGHFIAMMVFKYRNLKMFFLPLMGAAVVGESHNVASWKKVIVYLAGPVPGIIVGPALMWFGQQYQLERLHELGLIMLILNQLNLVPILPLDGGWVMHQLLFSRHPILQVVFRMLAAGVMLVLYWLLDEPVLMFIGVVLGMSLPSVWKSAKVTEQLRCKELDLTHDQQRVMPIPTLAVMIGQLKQTFTRSQTVGAMSTLCLNVYESLVVKPLGVLASFSLGLVYVLAMLPLLCFVLEVSTGWDVMPNIGYRWTYHNSEQSDMGSNLRYEAGTLQVHDRATPQGLSLPRVTLFGLFGDDVMAEHVYDQVHNQMPSEATLTCMGSLILLEFNAADTESQTLWSEVFAKTGADCRWQKDDLVPMLGLSLAGLPVDRLEQLQLLAGLNAIVDGRLIMPWHPTFKATPQQQRARYTLDLLHHGDWLTRMPSWTLQWDDPYRKQIAELAKQVNQVQDDAQRQILLKQYNELIIKQENHRLQAIRELGDTVIDPAVIDLESDYPGMASWTLPPAEQVAYQKQLAVYKSKLAPLIGVMPDGDMSVVRYGNTMGQILSTRGRTAMLNLQFFSPAAGLPALIRWLESEGGRDFEYVLMPSIQ